MVHSLYLDFFKFLDHLGEDDPWFVFQRIYMQPHAEFFKAYWRTSNHFENKQIAERVRQIKEGDYGLLKSLVQAQDPAALAEESLKRCRSAFSLHPEPCVYLFVGFFSADGMTIEVDGRSSAAIGLERFKDFKDLPLLVSHEYCHCAQRFLLKDIFPERARPLFYSMVAEGLAVFFTEMVYPEVPLHRHLFLTPERLHWCRQNKDVLLELAAADLSSEKLVPVLFGAGDPNAGLPPRVGYFVARQMLLHCLSQHGAEEFGRSFPGFEEFFRKIPKEFGSQSRASERR